jgi:AraC-like DNA-binding protein
MMLARGDFSTFRFSSAALRPADRVPFYRDFVARALARMDIESVDDRFHCDARLFQLPDLTISRVSISAVRAARSREMAQGNDNLALVVNLHGLVRFAQLGREASLASGSAVLISDADASRMERTSSRSLSIHVPRAVLAPLLSNPDVMLLSPTPRALEALRLLVGYVELLIRDHSLVATAELRHLAVNHVLDLVAVTLGAARDHAEVAAGRGLRAARMRAIKSDIVRNLAGGDVTAVALSGRHGVSPRYVRKLFEAEDTSLSQFVLGQRLTLVRRMLLDPGHAHSTIGALAFAAGFGDLSTFNREFRRRFGMTPSDVRDRARA